MNLGLQVWDGLATYYGLQLGEPEGNPLLQAIMMEWGVGWALLGAKSAACMFLVILRALGTHQLIARALILTASYYVLVSFIPWMFVFLRGVGG